MKINSYEAMFLLENNAATADFDGTSSVVDQILEKHGATLVQKEKWDERKLAYEIKGQRRATYYLVYFTAPTTAIRNINEDVQLTEVVLRHLVMVLAEPIETHIEKRDTERELLAEDSRKNSLGGWGDRRKERNAGPRRPREDAAASPAAAPAAVPAEAAPASEARPEDAAAEKPAAEEPAAEKPAAEKPAPEKPAAEEPAPVAAAAAPEKPTDDNEATKKEAGTEA